jgi:hypothetical protein
MEQLFHQIPPPLVKKHSRIPWSKEVKKPRRLLGVIVRGECLYHFLPPLIPINNFIILSTL